MKWLLWREYRLNRLILIAGGVLFLLPYAMTGMNVLTLSVRSKDLLVAWQASTISAYLLISLLAGNAIAGERADRSAEFIAYMPLNPLRTVASKLLLALIAFAPMWCVIYLVINHTVRPWDVGHVLMDLRPFLVNIFVIYCVGWLFTSYLSSATTASVIGLIAAALISVGHVFAFVPKGDFGHEYISLISDPQRFGKAVSWYVAIWVPFAIACFGIGTWNYLRREKS